MFNNISKYNIKVHLNKNMLINNKNRYTYLEIFLLFQEEIKNKPTGHQKFKLKNNKNLVQSPVIIIRFR